MTSYLRSWLSPQSPLDQPNTIPVKSSTGISLPGAFITDDDDDDSDDAETVRGDSPEHDDSPPAFPSIDSAQRMSSTPSIALVPSILTDSDRMPPPPLPALASSRRPGPAPPSRSNANTLGVPSSGGLLALPPTTTKAPPKVSRKVALAPGHGPLDWANLKKSGTNLRGVDTLTRVTPSMLKQHNKREDAWSAFQGKVYNITTYLSYHPGGEKELMRVAGRDGTKLFALTHAWVNVDYMLDECLVGFVVPEA